VVPKFISKIAYRGPIKKYAQIGFSSFLCFFYYSRIFAFVAKRSTSSADNQCHIFCELEPSQPATAIVSFANKVLLTSNQQQQIASNAL
jgi:hypothetical protein